MNMFNYEDILENLAEGVVAVDTDLKVRVFNQSAEKIAEISRSSVFGKPVEEVFPRDQRLVEMLSKTITEGRVYAEYEEKLHRRFSGPLAVGITTNQIFDPDGRLTGAVALVRDLSGVKSLEVGSLRKERLAYIGTFAASLAHEIKNPLSGIRGAAQLLKKRLSVELPADYIGIIIRETDRLNGILDEMLDFARPSRLVKKEVNIHKVLDTVVTLLGEGAPLESVVREFDPSIPPVYGDEGQLTQVFLNLVKNAKEAIPEDGKIHIITRMTTEFHLVDGTVTDTGGRAHGGKTASVEIRDNGSGIKPEYLEKIFTPFFTTKPKGSGLGMAVSLKIIKEHGGILRIDSEPGAGTTVVVYLPIA